MPGQPGVDYMLDRPPYTRYYWDGTKMAELGAVSGAGNSLPRNRIVKRGSTLIDLTVDTGWAFSGAGTVYSVSAEVSRRRSFTRKVDMTNATADALLTWSNAVGVVCDPIDKLFSIDVFIPEIVQANVGGTVSINISLSNTTTYAAPGGTWTVNSNYLRQGWNTITLCGKDADGALGADRGVGTLPYGMSKSSFGGGNSPLDWSLPIKFVQITVTYNAANKRVFFFDEIRVPAKIKPFVCLGWDATGASISDNIYTSRLAPFLAARKVPSYFTMCWVFDGLYQGTAYDTRRDTLYGTYGWDAINHSWSHGASVPGAYYASGNTLTISGGGTLATLNLSGAHGWPIGSRVLMGVFGATGASATNALGVFMVTVTTSTAVTYPITGGTDGVAGGTVRASTYLNDVFNSAAVTNQPIVLPAATAQAALNHEWVDLRDNYSRPKGMLRGSKLAAYPNNSYPDMKYMKVAAAAAGIVLARGLSGTTCKVSELGIDNPLAIGSCELNSGSTGSTLQDVINAITGAVNRGEGLFIFGHYLRDEALDVVVDIDSPPGKNGNPAAPGASPGLWWYAAQLEKLVNQTLVPLRDAGTIDLLSASDVVAQLGE